MIRPRKKQSLATRLRERSAVRRWASNATAAEFDYDWARCAHNRIALVNLLLSTRPHGRYLEIGCADDALFQSVLAVDKVGVDPVRGGTHRLTSDAFFAAWTGAPFDVVFIDGLHLYPQVHRDLDNALRHLAPGGWIAMHDMLPRDWLEEHVPQIRTSGWTGDGWKVAFEITNSPALEGRLVAIDHGVMVLRACGEPALLADLSSRLADKRFGYLHEHVADLPIVGYEAARAWVESIGREA